MIIFYIAGIIFATYALHTFCNDNKLLFDPSKKSPKNIPILFNYLMLGSLIFYVLLYYFCFPHDSIILLLVYVYCFIILTMDTARILYYFITKNKKGKI